MNNELIYEVLEELDVDKKIETVFSAAKFLKKNPEEIINIAVITDIARNLKPNYNHYNHIWITGRTIALRTKGKASRKTTGTHGIENQLEKLIETYGHDEINNDILNSALDLIVLTIHAVMTGKNKKLKRTYEIVIQDIEFLHINLELCVKIIAEALRRKNVQLSNMTLHYMSDLIALDKDKIVDKFVDAYSSGDEEKIKRVKEEYREIMSKYFQDFLAKQDVPFEQSIQLGIEELVRSHVSQEVIDNFVGLMLMKLKFNLISKYELQLTMF